MFWKCHLDVLLLLIIDINFSYCYFICKRRIQMQTRNVIQWVCKGKIETVLNIVFKIENHKYMYLLFTYKV
jgi:hypothetical protein